jgi:octaprenyl-diphosphate synthase
VDAAVKFGQNIGIIFQIRDDIFDYYDSKEIGKPTGNDMAEGKLTLPAIYAINSTQNEEMIVLARKVKARSITPDEIARLVEFTKLNGGIEYAERRMMDFHQEAQAFIEKEVKSPEIAKALQAYLDFVIQRNN